MENLFLAADKFEGRLNMSIFTNIEKSISENDFRHQYPNPKYTIITKSNIDQFVKEVYKATGGEIKKGGFNDTEEVDEYLKKAREQLSALKPVNVLIKGKVEKVYVIENKPEVLSKGKEDELNKGVVSEAFDYYSNGISFSKSGVEIKTRAAGIRAVIELQISDVEKEIEDIAGSLPKNPTKTVDGYGFSQSVRCPYKTFPWEMTYYSDSRGRVGEYGEESIDCCDSAEEAKINSLHNEKVHQWLELSGELKAVTMYEHNLEDKKNYDLTARQMIALGF